MSYDLNENKPSMMWNYNKIKVMYGTLQITIFAGKTVSNNEKKHISK